MTCPGPLARLLLRTVATVAAVSPGFCSAALVGAGDIAFIRFNADGTDDLAIVLLADAALGQQVHFNDNVYSSTYNVFAAGEDSFTWTATEALAAGTVVTFGNLDSGTSPGTVNHGTITGNSMRTMRLSAAGESVYAFLGVSSRSPTTFLAAVTTENSNVLNGTGLVAGDTAVVLPLNIDEAHYFGSRDTAAAFSEYRSLIGNVGGHWQVRTTDGGVLSPAFDPTNFSLASGAMTPESAPMVLLAALGMLLVLRMLQQPRMSPESEGA